MGVFRLPLTMVGQLLKSPVLPLYHPQHPLKSLKKWKSPALKPYYWCPSYAGQYMSIGWRIIASLLAITKEGLQKSEPLTAWKKLLGDCHIDHHWYFTLGENHDAWHLTTSLVVSFENTCRAILKNKRNRRRNCNTMPSLKKETLTLVSLFKVERKNSNKQIIYIYIYIYICIWIIFRSFHTCSVSWGCRIQWLHLCSG